MIRRSQTGRRNRTVRAGIRRNGEGIDREVRGNRSWLFHRYGQRGAGVAAVEAGAGQIDSTQEFGFEVDLPFRELPLVELRDLIDREFLVLSQAHYDRYLLAPDLFRGQPL